MSTHSTTSIWQVGRTAVGELYDRSRILCLVALANLGLAVVFTVLMVLDGRTLLGRNIWTKPWKFATSIAIFTATVGWLLPSISLPNRTERAVATVIGAAMTIEITLIGGQAARGVASHFNSSTPIDTGIYMVMGITITISSIVVGYLLWQVIRRPPDIAPAYLWGIGLGMFVFLIASFEGWLMISRGGHAVGTASDSPGLPLLNWTVTGGDLRIAHFTGLHALQVLPFAGYLAATWDRLTTRGSLFAVGAVTILYSGFTVMTFLQAIAGNPFVATVIAPWLSPAVFAGIILVGSLCVIFGLTVVLHNGSQQGYSVM